MFRFLFFFFWYECWMQHRHHEATTCHNKPPGSAWLIWVNRYSREYFIPHEAVSRWERNGQKKAKQLLIVQLNPHCPISGRKTAKHKSLREAHQSRGLKIKCGSTCIKVHLNGKTYGEHVFGKTKIVQQNDFSFTCLQMSDTFWTIAVHCIFTILFTRLWTRYRSQIILHIFLCETR